ncbi:hypothetical protein AMTR_s00005p00248350 [Amborella trichopoda]|uniref:Aminotransferase-like plant mobile domain-containing protein n=1 Tax=Amborella trichopoda TaxID=13333 RepID=W1PGP1_AMBTC|nr:hypothetical protein AMTR_s00005p00248350 [Amborella trichopoda]
MGNKGPTSYLKVFEDFDRLRRYAWGATTLTYLFRSLYKFVIKKKSYFSGVGHLSITTLLPDDEVRKVRVDETRAKLWRPPVPKKNPSNIKTYYRQEMDLLDSSKQPYIMEPNDGQMNRDEWESSSYAFTSAMCNSYLICDNIAKRYLPKRVPRQLSLK